MVDVVVSGGLLLVLLPTLLLVAALIAIDTRGPVLSRHADAGREDAPFRYVTFRTTYVDDPRLTRSGRLVRRTSLEELPHLLNVLRGDTTLTGTRPGRGSVE